MTRTSSHIILTLTLILSSLPFSALASHYYLEDIDLLPAPISAELKAIGIQTTEDFLLRVLSSKDRQSLDASVSMSMDEIDHIAHTIELMQLDGIGPKAARLLRAAGVASVKDLGSRDPSALLDLVIAANAKHRHTEVNPDLLIIEDWVQRAKEAPHHVQ